MNLANMKRSETTEQISLFNWAKRIETILPELALMYHVPNEGKRTNGNVLKAMGLKSGVPDVVLPVPNNGFHGLYLEMKYGKNKATKEQRDFLDRLKEKGYKTAVCYGCEEAQAVILDYLSEPGRMPKAECIKAPWIMGKCDGVQMPSKIFARKECAYCKHHTPNKEEQILRDNLTGINADYAKSIVDAIFYLSCGRPLEGYSLEDTLETINKSLATLVRSGDLEVKQSAAVLEVAIKAYKSVAKGEVSNE